MVVCLVAVMNNGTDMLFFQKIAAIAPWPGRKTQGKSLSKDILFPRLTFPFRLLKNIVS